MSKRQVLLLAVFVASIGPFIWKYLPESMTGGKSVDDWLKLVSTIVLLLSGSGVVTENQQRVQGRVVPFRLTASFRGGLFGGLIGGAIAGLISGVVYYVKYRPEVGFQVVLEILLYGALLGATLGGCCLFIILLCRHLVMESRSLTLYFLEVTGGLAGGLIGGTVVGILGGWYFYPKARPAIDIWMILLGAVVAPLVVAGGALLYDYGGRLRNAIPTVVGWAVVTTMLATITMLVLQWLGIGEEDWWETIGATKSGAILGGGIGAMLGLQVGITLVFYRLQEVPAEPET